MNGRIPCGALAGAAAAYGIADGGGLDQGAQWRFAIVSLAAGAAAVAAGGYVRHTSGPVVASLLGIALLSAMSVAWTHGERSDALRAAALWGSYAAIAIAARVGLTVRFVSIVVAAAASITAVLGVVSALQHSTSFAEWVDGGWRPQGPFASGPALALLQVCALPMLLRVAARARPVAAGAACAGLALAAAVLVLDASRTAIGATVIVVMIALGAPGATVGASRRRLVPLIVAFVGAGAWTYAIAGGWHGRHAPASGSETLLVACGLVGVSVGWAIVSARISPDAMSAWGRDARPRRVALLAGLAVACAVVIGLASGQALSDRRFPSHQGVTHGRTWIWRVAADAARDRPILGSGAGSFFRATILDQPGYGRLTRYAHSLPLENAAELGLLGLLLSLGLYGGTALALWRARGSVGLWLLGPAAAAILASNLVDWTWHFAGIGAVFALAIGALGRAERTPRENP